MPLTELLRTISGEMDAPQERAPNSSDPSARPETDFCELVWENGNVMMQGQTNKARKGLPSPSDYHSLIHSVVPSSEMGFGQDADMGPWLNYQDPLNNDYACDFLHELSGVTMNDVSTDNHLAFKEKKNGCDIYDVPNSASLKFRDTYKVHSNLKNSKGVSSEVPPFAASSQNNVLRSGVSDITKDNVASRDLNSSSLCAFTSMRLQKLDAGQPSTSTSFTNFPYFSRPSALAKANHLTVTTPKRLEDDERRCSVAVGNHTDSMRVNLASGYRKDLGTDNPSGQATGNVNSESLPKTPTEDLRLAKNTIQIEDAMNDPQQNHVFDGLISKVGGSGERNAEPVVAVSSVCSGNSVGKASNERACDLKRKLRETTESEGPSEEVEDESIGAKKAAHARASSKRVRAAEVHNLSERRRRDRINEKMRALQELIPNCNKVDKASMLDEAIEYLKTLQLQVQMFSMGAGLYMQPMMVPPGLQPIHGAQMPHFSPMGLGMGMALGMGMGFGMNMPFQTPPYPVPGPFHGIPGSSLQPYAHPGQGLQMSVQRSPVLPIPGPPPMNIPMGLNASDVGGSSGASILVPPSSAKDSCPQVMPSIIPNMPMSQATFQATKEGIQPSVLSHDRRQSDNPSGNCLAASGTNNAA